MKKDFYKQTLILDDFKQKSSLASSDVQYLLKQLNALPLYKYFFYNLDNPLFVNYLPFRKFISKSLSDQRTNRPFYASDYLKRIAKNNSNIVSQIISNSKPKELMVKGQLLQTILQLDVKDAAALAQFSVENLITKGLFEGKIIADLIIKFIDGGKKSEALLLFDFITQPTVRQILQLPGAQTPVREEAEGRLEDHEFEEVMKDAFPKLLECSAGKVIHIFERNLKSALDIESRFNKVKRKEDYSYIWRPAIEDHEQNYNYGGIKELLVALLRDSLNHPSIKEEKDVLSPLLQKYLKSPYTIFKRLALYTLSENINIHQDIITSILMNTKMLNDHRIQHEMYRLINKSFSQINPNVQCFLLKWIDDGPKTKWWIDWRIREEKKQPSNERIQEFKDHWRLERYSIIKEHIESLYPDKIIDIEKLEKQFGVPEHPDFPSWNEGVTVGWESPMNTAELLQKNDIELIELFNNPPPLKRPDPIFPNQGLGMVFTEAIKQEPARFFGFADTLANNKVPSVFIGFYFHGLRETWGIIKNNWEPAWTENLNKLSLLIAETEPNLYGWTTKERSDLRLHLCRFIEAIVSNRNKTLDESILANLKQILLSMIGDPNPDAEEEYKNYATNKDWPFIALNTTGGEVLHALLHYCLCYARSHKAEGERLESDVRTALENVLETETRPSVRSVFGTYLANLWYLDPTWTKKNIEKIFPISNKQVFNAVWDSYLKFNNIYKEIFESTRQYYLQTINSGIKQGKAKDFDLSKLAQQLSMVYWRGWEDITDEHSTIAAFFKKAPLNLRSDFVRQIWFGLEDMKKTKELNAELPAWKRAKELWVYRIAHAKSVGGHSRQEDEVSAYLEWLSACPENVDTMEKLISRSLRKWKAQYSGGVTEYLALQSEKYPLICIKLLTDFFKRPWDRSPFYFDDKEVRKIMESALSQGGECAKRAASLSSLLGEYGRFDFKDIWDKVNAVEV